MFRWVYLMNFWWLTGSGFTSSSKTMKSHVLWHGSCYSHSCTTVGHWRKKSYSFCILNDAEIVLCWASACPYSSWYQLRPIALPYRNLVVPSSLLFPPQTARFMKEINIKCSSLSQMEHWTVWNDLCTLFVEIVSRFPSKSISWSGEGGCKS